MVSAGLLLWFINSHHRNTQRILSMNDAEQITRTSRVAPKETRELADKLLRESVSYDLKALIARTKVQPRPYQDRIINKVLKAFIPQDVGGGGLTSVMVNSPTGSGKTVMALIIAKALQEMMDCHVGWISMRRNLLTQAAKENMPQSDSNPNGKDINADIYMISMFDKNPPAELASGVRKKPLILFVDEAQHDAANSSAHIHATLQPDFIIGLSATPFRTDKIKLCFDKVINDAGIGTLIREGFLSQFDHYTIEKWTPVDVTSCYLREPYRWGKSIMYFHTVDQCNQAAAILRAANVRCEVVTGDSDKDTQIEQFKKGELDVLLNCMVLTEGFDDPSLQSVFVRPSCKGVTMQMAGRAFRKHPVIKIKNVIQCGRTKWPFVRTADPVHSYKWTVKDGPGMWISLKVNEHINEMNCKMIQMLAQIPTSMPDFITKAREKKSGGRRRLNQPQQSQD